MADAPFTSISSYDSQLAPFGSGRPPPAPTAPAPSGSAEIDATKMSGQEAQLAGVNSHDPHVPVMQTNTDADNAPALEPGQPQGVPPTAAQTPPPTPVAQPTVDEFGRSAVAQEVDQDPNRFLAVLARGNIFAAAIDRMFVHPDADTEQAQEQVVQARRAAEQQADQDIRRMGAAGYVLNLANGLVDPISLSMMAVPVLGEARLAKLGYGVLTNVAAGEAQQFGLSKLQETTKYSDNLGFRISANALLGGVLGGAIASKVPRPEFQELADHVDRVVNQSGESTAGAAAVKTASLEDKTIARGGQTMAYLGGYAAPSLHIMTRSQVPEARALTQELVDTGGIITKENERGIATAPSLEAISGAKVDSRQFQQRQALDQAYDAYTERLKGTNETPLSKNEFGAEVLRAHSRLDKSEIPEAAKLSAMDRQWFNQDHADGVQFEIFEDGGKLVGAPSYSPRVVDNFAMLHDQVGFENAARDWFTKNPKLEEVELPKVKHGVETEEGGPARHTVTSEHGYTTAYQRPQALQVTETETEAGAQGSHQGTARLVKMVEKAHEQNIPLTSDTRVSKAAAKTYANLKEMGYDVRENPHDVEGNDLVSSAGRPVFEVFPAKGKVKPLMRPTQREPAEIEQAVQELKDRYLGMTRGTADIGFKPAKAAPLKARTNDMPDELLWPWMSHDYLHVMDSYHRSIVPQIEAARMFEKDGGFEARMDNIKQEYFNRVAAAKTNEEKTAIKQEQADIMNKLDFLYKKVLNQTGAKVDQPLWQVRGAHLALAFNYARSLGAQTASAIPDPGRLIARYGLGNTMLRMSQFLSGLSHGLITEDAQRMGTAFDIELHTRQHSLEGTGEGFSGSSKLLNAVHNSTSLFTKLTLIAHWDQMMRSVSSQLVQDSIYKAITRGVSDMERAQLAAQGIGDKELQAIAKMWEKHGSNEFGLNRARTDLWTDRAAAQNVEQAVRRAGMSTAFYVGKGDMPQFVTRGMMQMLLQFKGFVISSVSRLAIPLAQGLAHGDIKAANGLLSLITLGGVSYYLHELADGNKPDLSPGRLAAESVQRSGVLSYAPDLYDPLAGWAHLPRFSKFQDLDPFQTLFGPTGGTVATILGTTSRAMAGQFDARDLHKWRQLIPYNNLFYFDRLVNAAEGNLADYMQLRGAMGNTFGSYFDPTQDKTFKQKNPDRKHFLGQQWIPNSF